jgi:hypothetical protein
MLIPPTTLENLIAADKDIISALYFQRKPPYRPVVCMMKKDEGYRLLDFVKLNTILDVDIVGFGCVLIKREVFEKLKERNYSTFFNFKNISSEAEEQLNEDMTFCENARKEGFKIHLDTSIVCKHIGEILVDENISYLLLENRMSKDHPNL